MTETDRNKILILREQHKSYKTISDELGVPINTVKSYISRKMRKLKASEAEQNGFSEYKKCKQCGILMHQTEHCKGKKFCSDRCRIIWWNANRDLALRASAHQQICTVCGSTFFTYHGQYCSRACYGKARSQKAGVNHG